MRTKFSVVAAAGLVAMAGFVSQASAGCMDAKGKIANNGQLDGTTLGIVKMKLGKTDSYKCGIIGKPQDTSMGGPDFRHTVVCDNHAGSDEAQAQVTLNTRFLSARRVSGHHGGRQY